jgi:hypothetical protein
MPLVGATLRSNFQPAHGTSNLMPCAAAAAAAAAAAVSHSVVTRGTWDVMPVPSTPAPVAVSTLEERVSRSLQHPLYVT